MSKRILHILIILEILRKYKYNAKYHQSIKEINELLDRISPEDSYGNLQSKL